jgi:hypothetical protein
VGVTPENRSQRRKERKLTDVGVTPENRSQRRKERIAARKATKNV